MDMRALVKAVKKHSEMDDEQIAEAGEHGADAGWPGVTYTRDTVDFYDEHNELIWDLLNERAEDMDVDHPLAMIAFFNQARNVSSDDSFKNLLAWFALEEVGRYLVDQEN